MANEELLYLLLSGYAEKEGAQLREELITQDAVQPTPGLDKKVRRKLFALKYKVHFRIAGAVAACLALALMLPPILQLQQPGILTPQPQIAVPAPAAGSLPETEVEAAEAFDSPLVRMDLYADDDSAFNGEFYIESHFGDLLPELILPQSEYVSPFEAAGFSEDIEEHVQWYGAGEGILSDVEPPQLNFDLPEGFYLARTFIREHSYTYVLGIGLHRYISLTVMDYEGVETERYFEYEQLSSMQINNHTLQYFQDYTIGVYVTLVKDGVLYQVVGGPSSLEDIIVLAEAIIGG